MKTVSFFTALLICFGLNAANAQTAAYIDGYAYSQPQQAQYYTQPTVAYAAPAQTAAVPTTKISDIVSRGVLRCGSDMSVNTYTRFVDGKWEGFDADFCRVLAQALLGDSEKIEMVNVGTNDVAEALNGAKIDIMLSGSPSSAALETSGEALNAGALYYDYQMLLARTEDPNDLESYHGKKVCMAADSEYSKNFEEYNSKYNMGITYLTFADFNEAKRAFLLKRCQLLTAGSLLLKGISNSGVKNTKILPNKIAIHPAYAYVQKNNNELRLAVKWILNALYLTEEYDINAKNIKFYSFNDNMELKNLMGEDAKLWSSLKVRPRWLVDAVAAFGNYADIYERNLGKDSEYQLERVEGNLLKNGGTIYPIPFM